MTEQILNEKINKLREKMIEKLGVAPQPGIMPTLKLIFDTWIFYNENKPTIDNMSEINLTMSVYIDNRMDHAIKTAYVVFGLSKGQFRSLLKAYIDTGKVPEMKQSTEEEMQKRAHVIQLINKFLK